MTQVIKTFPTPDLSACCVCGCIRPPNTGEYVYYVDGEDCPRDAYWEKDGDGAPVASPPAGAWGTPGANAGWIANVCAPNDYQEPLCADATYLYKLEWYVDDPDANEIFFRFMVDNYILSLKINGTDHPDYTPPTDQDPCGGGFVWLQNYTYLQLYTELLMTGINTIEMEVLNTKGTCTCTGPTGLLVEFLCGTVPES